MIANTHIIFSKYIFSHCLKHLNFKLNKVMFIYGNIKPDFFPEGAHSSHTIRTNIMDVKEYAARLMTQKLDINEFSLTLGVLCHYICDFFCIYHNERCRGKSLTEHIKYELLLHIKLKRLLSNGSFKPLMETLSGDRDILWIISDLQESYDREMDTAVKDLSYAVTAAMIIAESIICCSELFSRPEKNHEMHRVLVTAK